MNRFLAFIVIIAVFCGSSYAETINVGVLEFCPFVCEPDKEHGRPGFSIEIEKTVFERAGYQIDFDIVPYIRSIKMTELGQYDAVGYCNDASSEVNICSKETVGPMLQTFYVKKGNPVSPPRN
jgi:polar amino acid transport system substrate-binding protein